MAMRTAGQGESEVCSVMEQIPVASASLTTLPGATARRSAPRRARLAGIAGRGRRRLLPAAHWLHHPRRPPPGHEPPALDVRGHSGTECFGHHSVLYSAAADPQRLPTMRELRPEWLQLLPALQP